MINLVTPGTAALGWCTIAHPATRRFLNIQVRRPRLISFTTKRSNGLFRSSDRTALLPTYPHDIAPQGCWRNFYDRLCRMRRCWIVFDLSGQRKERLKFAVQQRKTITLSRPQG
jgi:hypothetical protein